MGNILISLLFASLIAGGYAVMNINNTDSLAVADVPEAASISAPSQDNQLWVTITAYSSDPNQTDETPFETASGAYVREGIIAANFLKFGTKVRIPELFGDREFVVKDRLHSKFSDRIDVWMPSSEQAKQFGRQYALVKIEL
jgi:3D (Asp-Asp-Asp) domain-containing protein